MSTSIVSSTHDTILGALDDSLFAVSVDTERIPISCDQPRGQERIRRESFGDLFSLDDDSNTFTSSTSNRCSEAIRLVQSLEEPYDEPISLSECCMLSDSASSVDHETMLNEFASHWDALNDGLAKGDDAERTFPLLPSGFDFVADEIMSTFG